MKIKTKICSDNLALNVDIFKKPLFMVVFGQFYGLSIIVVDSKNSSIHANLLYSSIQSLEFQQYIY
tara:strand:- start:755 stop:952 length:198 start_codon:yes stop_codon:yes gene_type:complete